eukprot:CAMPEP_0113490756 /NCGR_PEP_ID=MMETSP0014_2-20120614/27209_1 /TAXON_ID=2857 /ORGANISM="Nitzschia sp." /LENGTH=967 /DNA_ID=CAMNT_0000384535 /DNA_START=35 /DNA_END=2934 /DNA_ORIENTATION=+ /assembly_acc=CAM_ASM_000159
MREENDIMVGELYEPCDDDDDDEDAAAAGDLYQKRRRPGVSLLSLPSRRTSKTYNSNNMHRNIVESEKIWSYRGKTNISSEPDHDSKRGAKRRTRICHGGRMKRTRQRICSLPSLSSSLSSPSFSPLSSSRWLVGILCFLLSSSTRHQPHQQLTSLSIQLVHGFSTTSTTTSTTSFASSRSSASSTLWHNSNRRLFPLSSEATTWHRYSSDSASISSTKLMAATSAEVPPQMSRPTSNRNNPQQQLEQQQQQQQRRRKKKMKPMAVTGYNAKAIEEFYDARPLQVGWRLNSLGFPLLIWYLGLLVDKALKIDDDPNVQRKRGRELRQAFVQSRSVALIKSGQALSLRPDLIRNEVWAEELGKLVDAVGSFSDMEAMTIIQKELSKDVMPRLKTTKETWYETFDERRKQQIALRGGLKLTKFVENDPILSLFDFDNAFRAVASASIGQVYRAKIRPGPQLTAAIGPSAAAKWGGRTVAIKVQRPDVASSASLDMYLLRRTATWLSQMRGGNLVGIADQFGMQLFGELDYIREANNCERFRELYGDWDNVMVPDVCTELTRKRVLVMEWVDGEKGPWPGNEGIDMVQIGLQCSVDQLMTTGLFHADPHRGNLLKTPDGKLAFIDFGMMADIDEEDRYGLFGLVIGLQSKDLPLITENLLKLGFLDDTTQLDELVPRLRSALLNSTGGTGKASDVNFARLQAELDAISRENVLRFTTPPFFTVIIRSLTILEGVALSVDPRFRLVRGSYPYVLRQLLVPDEDDRTPAALQKLLVRLLTVNGQGKEIEWERLRDLLRLAQKSRTWYNPADQEDPNEDSTALSRQTIELFFKFLTSNTGLFLKRPLVHELAEAIDGMASIGEANLLRVTNGLLPPLPGMNGPVNRKVLSEMGMLVDTFRNALAMDPQRTTTTSSNGGTGSSSNIATANEADRLAAFRQLVDEMSMLLRDERLREDAGPLLEEVRSVIQMVAV